ncbi:MAG: response regulator [Oculatellaceae cyanobacterium Prado106]|nr:response regulator [Oculatellaceae cyanobacterium Prado106]
MTRPLHTLLIVEDFAPDRELYRRCLTADDRHGYRMLEAESVEEGLELYQTQTIDAILLDYKLPDGDGLFFLESLKAQVNGVTPPVVMVTGEGDERIAAQAIKLGVEEYLVKSDLTPDQLQVTMRTAIENARLRLQIQERDESIRNAIARERIVHHITLQIRQSLEPRQVLTTAVHAVRQFALADRAFIYRFNPNFSGKIVVESVGEGWPAALDAEVEDTYFMETQGEEYRQGRIQVVEDVTTAGLTDCHRDMLQQFQIRANLVVPIIQGEHLWGLLVLSQCDHPRQWQPTEIELLRQLADQIGIAIQQAELYQQVRQQNERFELAAAAVNCLIYDYDLVQNTIERSPGLTRLFGYTPAEADPAPEWWFSLIPDHQRANLLEQKRSAVLGTDISFCLEYQVRHRAGHEVWVQDQGFIVRDASGRAVRVVGCTTDISDRKHDEQQLKKSEAQLQLGVQVAGVAIAHFDYHLNQVTLSPEAATLYGFAPEDRVITRSQIHATFHPDDQADLEQIIAQVLDPNGAGWFDREHRVLWPSGEVRWLRVRKQVFFDRSGAVARPDYAILAAIDITATKQQEAERERLLATAQAAQQEAEAANRSKDEFVAVVAHELRSPLNSIAGWATLLQTRQLEESIATKALETITRNTAAQVQLVEDLLDISRLVRGNLQITLAPVNLMAVVEAVLDIVRPMAEAKQIHLATDLASPPHILGDFNRLQQIILNLLTNAIKFTPNHGQVSVCLEWIDLDGERGLPQSSMTHSMSQMSRAYAQVRIADTGKGICPEFLPVMFERYQQGQQNTGAKDGLGLGLAIVKHLVDLHGGSIQAESPGEGQGATFTLQLPLLETAVAMPEPVRKQTQENPLSGIKVLAVDDDPDQLDLLVLILEAAGAIVQAANSSDVVLRLLPQFQPRLLISDIAMPGCNGYELLQQVRSLPQGDIPAIALTAYSSTTIEERSLQAGFQHHLTKPVDPGVLVAAIQQLTR